METTLKFVEYTDKNIKAIGAGHQVVGISKKNKKYSIGNIEINKDTGRLTCTLYPGYYSHIAKLEKCDVCMANDDEVSTCSDTCKTIKNGIQQNIEYVDLGLSVKWAKCNAGANSEEEYGDYYTFNAAVKLFKHRDDRMPSKEEQNELLSGTTQEVVTINGILGTKFTSKVNSNYIFIPFAGYGYRGDFYGAGNYSRCWGSSIDDSNSVWRLYCDSSGYRSVYRSGRYCGYSVRGVSE